MYYITINEQLGNRMMAPSELTLLQYNIDNIVEEFKKA